MQKIANYINGELLAPLGESYLDNFEPATGKIYSQIPESDKRDLDLAVAAAEKAQTNWAEMPAEERSALLLKLADAIDAASDDLARAEAIDNGNAIIKTLPKALAEIQATYSNAKAVIADLEKAFGGNANIADRIDAATQIVPKVTELKNDVMGIYETAMDVKEKAESIIDDVKFIKVISYELAALLWTDIQSIFLGYGNTSRIWFIAYVPTTRAGWID